MRCAYCGVEVTNYPENGICIHCGGMLPQRPEGIRCQRCGCLSTGHFCPTCGNPLTESAASAAYTPPVSIPLQYIPHTAPVLRCPRCRSTQVIAARRGFSWGLGILGFMLFPVFGILLGFCGHRKPRLQCAACKRKWRRD